MYLDLFLTYAKVGVMTFGGGYAMLPLLKRELVDNKSWITDDELLDYYAIGQCTPGVVSVNAATFVGYKMKGAFGGIVATLGIIFPSIVIITLLATVLTSFGNNEYVKYAFNGISVAVCAMVTITIYNLINKSVKKPYHVVILGAAFVSVALLHLSPIYPVLAVGLFGVVKHFWEGRRKK